MTVYAELQQLLLEIEAEMRAWSVWTATPPAASALQSIQPFAIDPQLLAVGAVDNGSTFSADHRTAPIVTTEQQHGTHGTRSGRQ